MHSLRMISVVVPIHNTGYKLRNTIESICAQSNSKCEIICVNDNSTDIVTLNILKEYREKILIIDLSRNVGAGEARNIGLKYASGKYVIFLDSDDYYEPMMLEQMYSKITSENADVCICGSRWEYRDGTTFEVNPRTQPKDEENWILKIPYEPWNKLVKRKIIIENGIRFQRLSSSNDIFYSYSVIALSNKTVYIEGKPLVTHYLGDSSHISSNHDPRNIYWSAKKIWDVFSLQQKISESDIALLMMVNLAYEYERCRHDNIFEESYKYVRTFICEHMNSIKYENRYYSYLKNAIIKNDLEYMWLEGILEPETRIRAWLFVIKNEIKNFKKIFVWGLGKRGRAFIKAADDAGIKLTGVTDMSLSSESASEITHHKFESAEDALKMADCIIASNDAITDYISQSNSDIYILNLEKYCAL